MPETAIKHTRVAIWLVPAVRPRRRLRTVIAGLARRFDAPEFLPHLTLYSCRRSPAGDEAAILARLAAQHAPLELRATGLDTTAVLTKTLFVRCAASAPLLDLHRQIHAAVALPSDYRLDPHLSLLYHPLSAAARQQLVATTALPVATIGFDELRLVAIPERNDSAAAINSWQTLAACRLGGPDDLPAPRNGVG